MRLENVIWKYASGVDSSSNNAESLENLDEIDVEDVEHVEDVYEMYTQILKTEGMKMNSVNSWQHFNGRT